MLNRYLGKKTELLGPIMRAIEPLSRPGNLICDIFSGTLAVSLRLKSSGYRVAANDINLFSTVYGQAYLLNSDVPEAPVDLLLPAHVRPTCLSSATNVLCGLHGTQGYVFLDDEARVDRFRNLIAILTYLQAA
ncbi:MAG: DNA adenine methylase, partial [Vicinamibacteraceae bacterium]